MKIDQEVVAVEAGEKIEIFSRNFSSVPMHYEFTAEANNSMALLGHVEIHSKHLVFSKPIRVVQIETINYFDASIWDTFISVYVVAESAMKITIPKRVLKPTRRANILLVLLIFVLAVSVVVKTV